jgi:hypothetical protein
VSLASVLALAQACGDSTGPDRGINGLWDYTSRFDDLPRQTVDSDTGSFTFRQQGATLTGLVRGVGACVDSRGNICGYGVADTVRAGLVSGGGVTFSVGNTAFRGDCFYKGTLAAGSTDSLSGTATCGPGVTGTWRAVRGGDLGSVIVGPSSTRVVIGGSLQLRADQRTRSGNPAFLRVVVWSTSDPDVATVTSDGLATAVGSGTATVTATAGGTSGSATLIVPLAVALTVVAAGASAQTCALDAGGAAYCWGGVNYTPWPVPVAGGLTFVAVSPGAYYACGLATGGAAYCWNPSAAGPVPVPGGLTFQSLSAGRSHTCGLTTSGVAYCWGDNFAGQLGDGSTTYSATPVVVAGGLRFATVSAGAWYTCGVTTGGAAYCWGNNGWGGLGDGSTTSRSTPVAVSGGITFAALSAGWGHTCGVATSGVTYCWGDNSSGQLGNGSTNGSLTPSPVSGGLTFASASAGFRHTCGVTTSGAAYCWGSNSSGELGNGSTNGSATPVAVAGGLTFVSVSAAGDTFDEDALLMDHTCGISTRRVAYCWGANRFGQLGDGSTTDRSAPVRVAGQP